MNRGYRVESLSGTGTSPAVPPSLGYGARLDFATFIESTAGDMSRDKNVGRVGLQLRCVRWLRLTRGSTLGVVLLATSCSPDDGDPSVEAQAISISDANNYTAQTDLTIPEIEVAASQDVEICWDGITTDIQCQPIASPAEAIQQLTLLHFTDKDEATVTRKLADGQLKTAVDFDRFHGVNVDGASTCIKLGSLGSVGSAFDVASDFQPSVTELNVMLWSTGTTPGVGARTLAYVKPTAGSSNMRIDAPDGCTPGAELLDFRPDLLSLQPVAVSSAGPWRVDWSPLTRDSGGFPANPRTIDSALLGFYAGETVATLQEKILFLESEATALYEVAIDYSTTGRSLDLSTLVSRADGVTVFPGFQRSEAGVWLFGLRCSKCQNPSPVLLTVMAPTP